MRPATTLKRLFFCLALQSLLPLTAFAQPTPAPGAEQASPEEQAPSEDQPPQRVAPAEAAPDTTQEMATRGELVVLLFLENSGPFPAGVKVVSDDGATAITNDDGAARLLTTEGRRTVHIEIPASALPEGATEPKQTKLGEAVVAAGQTTQVIVNVTAAGDLASIDIESAVAQGQKANATKQKKKEVVVEYGVITGKVTSAARGEPVVGARIVLRGLDAEAITDEQGAFTLRTPVGVHSLSAIHTKFSLQTVNDVEVKKDAETTVTVELTPASTELEEIVITAPHIQGGVASVMSERRESTTVQDALGSEDIGKSPDGSASAATRRIVGASIVGGQFLFVRGLGGRYSNVRLNGVPMPSTDPDLPGFQLDLFPTTLLSSLTIAKTFSPDIPGDFAGGSLNVETRTFPEEFLFKISLSGGYNSETTFRSDLLDYKGGKTDWLGFDDGTRARPDELPRQLIQGQDRFHPEVGYTRDEIDEFGRSFPNNWKLTERYGYPDLRVGVSVGDSLDTSIGKWGYFFTLGYKNINSRVRQRVTSVRLTGEEPNIELEERETLNNEVVTNDVQIGALGTVSYSPAEHHSFTAVSLLTQNGSDRTQLLSGNSEREGTEIERTLYTYVERQLLFNQIIGKHQELGDVLDLAWQLSTARTLRDQPDTRNVLYSEEVDGLAFRGVTGSGEHLYTELQQRDFGGGMDAKLKLWEDATAKAGYMGRTGKRTFRARRYGVGPGPGAPREASLVPPEEFFDPENSGSSWRLTEVTSATDGYDAEQTLHAAYGMLEVPVFKSFRLVGGVRMERFHQQIAAVAPYDVPEGQEADDEDEAQDENAVPTSADRVDTDYLPGGTIIYSFSDSMSLRAAYGGTVARPQLRELAPFLSADYVRRRSIQGNPTLNRTFIHNLDLRWELFPTPTEVFAVSAFYKVFEDPIESIILDQLGNITYQNIDGASNYGAEFEARVGLDLLSGWLKGFSALANLAVIQSQVRLSEAQRNQATTAKRPLAGQSPYVANLGLGYEPESSGFSTFLYYNVFGRRIQDVGINELPDVYEEPFHSVDLTAFYEPDDHWKFGLSATNLLFAPVRFTQGGLNYARWDPGINVRLSLNWTF